MNILNVINIYTVYSTLHLVDGAQFLNIAHLSLLFPSLAAALSPAPVIVIIPLASMYASA